MTIADVVLGAIWVAAPYPRLARHGQLWGYVHDLTATLGHPAAPGPWTVR